MKGTKRKILAIMMALSMVFQSGISTYAADVGLPPAEKSDDTVMTSEPVTEEAIDTGEEETEEIPLQKQEEELPVEEKAEETKAEEKELSEGSAKSTMEAETKTVAQIGNNLYSTIQEAVDAAAEGDMIEIIAAGTYTLPNIPKNVTIKGTVDGVVFEHKIAGNIASIPNGAAFRNVAFEVGNVNYHGFQHNGGITFDSCSFNGKLFTYGDETYKNCTFTNTGDYNMWVYGGGHSVVYEGCTFTNATTGKFLNVYNEGGDTCNLTVKNCKFVNEGTSYKAAINIKETVEKTGSALNYNVSISGCKVEGDFPEASVSDKLVVGEGGIYQVDDRLADITASGITVTLDGVQVYPVLPEPVAAAKIGDVKYETLEAAFAAAKDGETIKVLKDCAGNGIKAPQGKFKEGLTVDFGGHTYTVDGTTVGSTGTETNGF
ncbi:MAG: hypothetical protein IKI23_03390, partial [Lachnospiraceae bacterium]|nr:hypothetical protein [Lachnospiraceae bacterium]